MLADREDAPGICQRPWVVGLVVVFGLVASMWVHNVAVTAVQFVALAAASGAFSVLCRRAVSVDLHGTVRSL